MAFFWSDIDSATANGFAIITLKEDESLLNSLTIASLVRTSDSLLASPPSTGVAPYKVLEAIPLASR